jgi:hypothetical protein
METLAGALQGVVVGAALSAALIGTTLYYGLCVPLTVKLLEWLGVASIVSFSNQKLEQIADAFVPFVDTILHAHGDPDPIDRAARQYAEAVAIITGAVAEALFYLAIAKGLDPILQELEGTNLARTLGPKRLREWINDGVNRIQGRPGQSGSAQPAPITSPSTPQPAPTRPTPTPTKPAPTASAQSKGGGGQNRTRLYSDGGADTDGAASTRGNRPGKGTKRDLDQVDDVAREYGIGDAERDKFGEYIEAAKLKGDGGSANRRGDFTYQQLRKLAEEYLREHR